MVNLTMDAPRIQLHQQVLLEITDRIASSDVLAEMLPVILNGVRRGTDALSVCVTLIANNRRPVYADASVVEGAGAIIAQQALDLLDAVSAGTSLAITDASSDSEWHALAAVGVKTLIVLPLRARQAPQGFLAVGFGDVAHVLDKGDQTFLAIVAGQTAVAAENASTMEAVRANREQLAAILTSTADPVVVIDHQDVIVVLNPAAQKALGVAVDAIGQPVSKVITAEPLLELLDKGGHSSQNVEWQNADGNTYAPHASEINADDPVHRGRVLILRDISRYKLLHDNQAEFVDTVLHDLRSPLTYMRGYADMLPMVGDMNARQKDFTDKIMAGIAQMTGLVENVLDAGRLDPETGYYEMSRDLCDVVKMTSEIVSTHIAPAEKKGLALISNIDPNLPLLSLDETLLKRALNNLVDNAIKYTPEGGTITVSAVTRDHQLLLSVKDTGLGISAENQVKLFQRFKRVYRAEHKHIKGSGLGLFIVRNVAQRHNGDAWVESAESIGSTFTIGVPIAGPNLPGADPESRAPFVAEKKLG